MNIMIWDCVVIGKGEPGATTVMVYAPKLIDNISANDKIFRITNIVGKMGMTIFRNTKEGKKLEELIKTDAPIYDINEYCLKVFVQHVDTAILMDMIELLKEEAFKDGKKAKAREIKRLLDL
jgi:hypothetical protein